LNCVSVKDRALTLVSALAVFALTLACASCHAPMILCAAEASAIAAQPINLQGFVHPASHGIRPFGPDGTACASYLHPTAALPLWRAARGHTGIGFQAETRL